MEVVAGVASVAGVVGIVGLVGQSINGLVKLQRLVHNMSNAHTTLRAFLDQIDDLKTTLLAIQDLMKEHPDEWAIGVEGTSIHILETQLRRCIETISTWVEHAQELDPGMASSVNVLMKRLRLASGSSTPSKFRDSITTQRQGLQMTLEILGRSLDIKNRKQSVALTKKLDEFTESQENFNNNLTQTLEAQRPTQESISDSLSAKFEPVSSQLDIIERASHRSDSSLASVASDISRLLEMVSNNSSGRSVQSEREKFPKVTMSGDIEWSCDALSGIESAFSEEGVDDEIHCLFCGNIFSLGRNDWSDRGRHMIQAHNFGSFDFHNLVVYDQDGHCVTAPLLKKHRRRARTYRFDRGPQTTEQYFFQAQEPTQTEQIFRARVNNLRDYPDDMRNHPGSQPHADVKGREAQTQFKIACLREEFILDGHYFPSLDDRYVFEDTVEISERREKASQMNEPSESNIMSSCHRNEQDTAEAVLRSSAFSNLSIATSIQDPEKGITPRDRINWWLLESLRRSENARIIGRYPVQRFMHDHIPMGHWLLKVLAFWKIDEAATGHDESYEGSDGAVDSRDNLRISNRMALDVRKSPQSYDSSDNSQLNKDPEYHSDLTAGEKIARMADSRLLRRQRSSQNLKLRRSRSRLGIGKSRKSHRRLGRIGVCALDAKARSKPSRNILTRLSAHDDFDIIIFGDKVILDEKIENWPICEFLICHDSPGFPLTKAIAYVNLRRPFTVNDVPGQFLLRDRRLIHRILTGIGVTKSSQIEVNRDGGPSKLLAQTESGESMRRHFEESNYDTMTMIEEKPWSVKGSNIDFINDGNTLRIDGITIDKPFIEKPVARDSHDFVVYYPQSQGGGARRLFKKVGNLQSQFLDSSPIPRAISDPSSSYVYEQLVPSPSGEEVRIHNIGSKQWYGENRASPTLHEKVKMNTYGQQITYLQDVTDEQRLMAERIQGAFGQRVCSFGVIRPDSIDVVFDVHGWSPMKGDNKYYDDCASYLRKLFIGEFERLEGRKQPDATA